MAADLGLPGLIQSDVSNANASVIFRPPGRLKWEVEIHEGELTVMVAS